MKPAESDLTSVLFVDDEPSLLRVIRRTLLDTPLEVLTASGAVEALAILAERPIDVIVSDIEMPGMDGLALMATVRRLHPRTMRMLLSGGGTLNRALDAINEGEILRFFAKPFDVDTFRRALEALADRIRQTRRDGEEEARVQRGAELLRWVDRRFPGTTTIERVDGAVVLDLPLLLLDLESAQLDTFARQLAALHRSERP